MRRIAPWSRWSSVDSEAKSAAPDLSTDLLPTGAELRGSVLDVLKALLPEFADRDAVLGIVGKLVAENSTMAQRLARIAARFKTSEKVSKAQLVLFADALRRGEGRSATTKARAHRNRGPGSSASSSPTSASGASRQRRSFFTRAESPASDRLTRSTLAISMKSTLKLRVEQE